jgi:hypothetical protein
LEKAGGGDGCDLCGGSSILEVMTEYKAIGVDGGIIEVMLG